ncbi:unnamed protein product [Caenorhabditis auriculariae]|uniref:Uncharacterized protein n=1 Tax=Caenorhabditis auriculariae TaxID=2777116 RepID=A0A8S1GMD8_9PELO|nr:unnamed protein product [Caenorhabditis auriculariae]
MSDLATSARSLKLNISKLLNGATKVVERDSALSTVETLYKECFPSIYQAKLEDVYTLFDLSTDIFTAAFSESVENEAKMKKTSTAPKKLKLRNRCFELATKLLTDCSHKKLRSALSELRILDAEGRDGIFRGGPIIALSASRCQQFVLRPPEWASA